MVTRDMMSDASQIKPTRGFFGFNSLPVELRDEIVSTNISFFPLDVLASRNMSDLSTEFTTINPVSKKTFHIRILLTLLSPSGSIPFRVLASSMSRGG